MLAAKGGHAETVQGLLDADVYTKASVKVYYDSTILSNFLIPDYGHQLHVVKPLSVAFKVMDAMSKPLDTLLLLSVFRV